MIVLAHMMNVVFVMVMVLQRVHVIVMVMNMMSVVFVMAQVSPLENVDAMVILQLLKMIVVNAVEIIRPVWIV